MTPDTRHRSSHHRSSRHQSSHGDRGRGSSSRAQPAPAALWNGWAIAEVVVLVLMLLLGGSSSQTPPIRMAAELLGLVLIAGPLVRAKWGVVVGPDRLLVALGLALALLMVMQLMPLSAAIWTALPGRAPFLAGDVLAFGHPIPRPLSLDPDETIASMLFLIPALALWLRLRTDAEFGERALTGFVIFLLISLALAAVQATAGPGEYHLYANTHAALPTGTFANRNHQAIAMDCGIVLAAMLERRWITTGRHEFAKGWLFAAGALLFATGALLTGSRAGAVLMVPALIGGIVIARGTGRRARLELLATIGALAVGAAVLILHPGGGHLGAVADRSFLGEDGRYLFWPIIADMVRHYAPWGIGFGAFPHAYEIAEPNTLLASLWLNHAHNDWLEYVLEAGLPGVLLALAFLAWLGWRLITARTGRASNAGASAVNAGASAVIAGAGVVIVLLLAHSVYDYPLRTIALSSLFALMLGLLVPMSDPSRAAGTARRGWLRWVIAGVSVALAAAAIVAQTIGFNAGFSSTPLLGAAVPLANTRASAKAALALAIAQRPPRLIARLANQAITHSPLTEPAFTALALIATDPARADRLFAQAHLLSRKDPVLLTALFDRARTRHDAVGELGAFDQLARQQKDTPAQDVALARDLSDPQVHALVADRLGQDSRWRAQWFQSIGNDRAALANLVALTHDLGSAKEPLTREDLAPLISSLLLGPSRNPPLAWQVWRSLNPQSDPLDWDLSATERIPLPFDWALSPHTAPGERGTIAYDNADGSAPVIAAKLIVLPAGAYRFNATGDTQGIIMQFDCGNTRLRAENGGTLVIPADCPIGRIQLKMPARAGILRTVRLAPVNGH